MSIKDQINSIKAQIEELVNNEMRNEFDIRCINAENMKNIVSMVKLMDDYFSMLTDQAEQMDRIEKKLDKLLEMRKES